MAGPATRILILCGLAVALAGCNEGARPAPEAEAAAPGTVRLVERDVEAPAVFQVTEPGLWDGRPSLGGVWVAHPAVKDPERIIIRNPENGKFVIGALFRRERANPGPKLQVSSDAASALGLLAGKPTTLNVTALRREEEPAPPAAPAAPEVQTAAAAPAGPAASDPPPAARAEAAAPARPRRGLFDFLRPKSAPDTAEDATAAEVTAAPLEPIQSAAAALDRADAAAAPRPAPAPAAAPRPAPAAAPAPAPAPQKPRATLDKPFIQIGIFSVEENASNTAAAFGRAGILPLVKAQETQGKKFWRVLVGPAPSAAERDALLKKVKAMGFTDAYFVSS